MITNAITRGVFERKFFFSRVNEGLYFFFPLGDDSSDVEVHVLYVHGDAIFGEYLGVGPLRLGYYTT